MNFYKKLKLFMFFLCLNNLSYLSIVQAQCPGANTPDCVAGNAYFGVVINEISGDGGNIDGKNEAIVELAGPAGTNIGGMVITNGEWAVVLPAGTLIPADGVFVIGCGSSTETVGTELASSGSGLTCAFCDFEGMPLDFDVCAAANAIFVSPSISTYGFTLDNGYCGSSSDGDQVALFQPDGTFQDGVFYGGNPATPATTNGGLTVFSGSTGLCGNDADHISVQDGSTYTLGDNDNNGIINDYTGSHTGRKSDGGNATGVNIMPAGNTNATNNCYTMPGLNDPRWVYAGNSFTGCNSSYVRLLGTTGSQSVGQSSDNPSHADDPDCSALSLPASLTPTSCNSAGALAQWGYTDHPTPGQPNNADIWDLFISICGGPYQNITNSCNGTLNYEACGVADVRFKFEIYNWQHVSGEGGITTTGEAGHTTAGNFGSYINIPASAGGSGAPSAWTYTNNLATGVTTLESAIIPAVPAGTHNFVLQWKDFIYECCGSTSATSNNECYERFRPTINIIQPLPAGPVNVTCPPTTAGTVNIKTLAGITANMGCNVQYQLQNNGVNVGAPNSTGIFPLPNSLTGPITVLVTSSCGVTAITAPCATNCNNSLTVNINNNCRIPPPACPVFANNAACTTANAPKCPGDAIQLGLDLATSTNLPNAANIEWVLDTDNDNDVYDETAASSVVATQTVTTTISATAGSVIITEIGIRPAALDGGGGGEFVELFNPGCTSVDIGCWSIGTKTNTSGGTGAMFIPSGTTLAPCSYFSQNLTFSLANGSAQVFLTNSSNVLVQGVSYGATAPTGSGGALAASGTCSAITAKGPLAASTPGITANAGGGNDIAVFNTSTSTWSYVSNAAGNPTPGSANAGAAACSCSSTTLTPACASYTIPPSACGTTVNIKPRIIPVNSTCVGTSTPTLPTKSYPVSCPTATITTNNKVVCGAASDFVIDFAGTAAGTTNVTVNYTKDGVAQPALNVAFADPLTVPVTSTGTYALTSVTFTPGAPTNCTASVSGDVEIVITPAPTVTLTGSTNITGCNAGIADDGTVTLSFAPAASVGPWVVAYTINGVPYEVTANTNPYTFTTNIPGTYTLVSVEHETTGCNSPAAGSVVVNPPPAGPTAIPTALPILCSDGVAPNETFDLATLLTTGAGSLGITDPNDATPDLTNVTWYTTDPTGMTAPIRSTVDIPGPPPTATLVGPPSNQDYYFVYTATNGCEVINKVTIDINTPPAAPTATMTQPTCALATGTITVNTPAPAAGISYTVTGTAPVVAPVSNTTGVFSGLTAGTYDVTVTQNGCTSTVLSQVIAAQPVTPAAPTATMAQPTCALETGTITVDTPAPAAGISYTVTGTAPVVAPVSNATGVFSGLAAGTYEVTVTQNGCTSTVLSQVIAAQPVTPAAPTATMVQPTCALATGTITVDTPAPAAGISYTVTGTAPVVAPVSNATGVFSGLAAGTYEVTVTQNGCTSTVLTQVIAAQPVTPAAPTATMTQPTCALATGTITVNTPAPAAGISYTVTGTAPVVAPVSNATGVFSGLAAGTYEVTVTQNGCTSTVLSQVIAAQPVTPAAPTATMSQPTCALETGTITVNTPAPAAGISYTVTGTAPVVAPVSNATGVFSGLAAGTYEVTVTQNGCTSTVLSQVIAAQPVTPAAPTATMTQPTCALETGTITVNTPAPAAGISYTVTGTAPVSNATGVFSGLAAGTYEVTVTQNGCTSTVLTQVIAAQPVTPAAPTATMVQPTCALATGTITVNTPAPAAGISYTVTGTAPVVAPVSNATGVFSGLAAGTYEVTVTQNGCTSTVLLQIITAAPGTPTAPVLNVTNNTCTPVVAGLFSVTTSCGVGTHIEYSTDNGGSWSTVLPAYANNVTVIAQCIDDASGCISANSNTVTAVEVSCVACPSFTGITPNNVTIVNSTCGAGCTVSGGSITAAVNNCPVGSTLQYSTDGGTTWGTIVPSYAAGVNVITRCNCDSDNSLSSSNSISLSTNPGTCTLPTVTIGSFGPYCTDAASVTLTGTPAGGTFTGTGVTGTSFDPATAGVGSHNITYIFEDANGCSNSASTTITVNGLPVFSLNETLIATCTSNGSVAFATFPAAGAYQYSYSTGGASYNAATATALASANAATTISTAAGTTYWVRLVDNTTGCYSDQSISTSLAPGQPTITMGAAPTAVCASSTAVVANYPYTATTNSPDEYSISQVGVIPQVISGLPTNAAIVASPFSITFPANAVAGTYNFNLTVTNTTNGCVSSVTPLTFVINPLPTVTIGSFGPYCADAASVTLTGTPADGTFTGTGVTGTSFDPATAGVGSHNITYTFEDANGCSNSASTMITVNGLPVFSLNETLIATCTSNGSVAFATFPAAGAYQYSYSTGGASYNAATATALASATAATTISTAAGTTYWVRLVDNTTGCYSDQSISTSLAPGQPTITMGAAPTAVCASSTAVVANYPYTATTNSPDEYSISQVGVIPQVISGLPTNAAIVASPFTITFPANAAAGTYNFNLTVTNTTNGCVSSVTPLTFVINPLPNITVGTYGPYCDNSPSVTLAATPTGGTYSGMGVIGSTFNPSLAGAGTHAITYSYTDLNGCSNSTLFNIVVNLCSVTYSLGNYVWYDANNNGVQDPGEAPIGGVTVNLYDASGTLIGTTVTNSSGYYIFTGLENGNYTVEFITPSTYVPTQGNIGSDASDSDITGSSNTVSVVINNADDFTIDAGYYLPASLGDFVWNDIDGDGVQDPGENGIPGAVVNLYDASGALIATTTTDANGNYSFTGLPPGTYTVTVTNPVGYANATTATSQTVTLASGENNPTLDFGFNNPTVATYEIGNYVWFDQDGDGMQDPSESGIGGVVVNLYDASGSLIATTTTDANGAYLFTGLDPGDYVVEFISPTGYDVTPGNNGLDNIDSDITSTDNTVNVSIVNANNYTIDAGYTQLSSLGSLVWVDSNNNGIQDPGEPGIPGATVTIFDPVSGTIIGTVVTDANGNWYIDGLQPGLYSIAVTSPVGYSNITTNSVYTVTLNGGEENLGIIFGFNNGPASVAISLANVKIENNDCKSLNVKWTASATNIEKQYVIEISNDGINYLLVKTVDIAVYNQFNNYSASLPIEDNGNWYIRLSSKDIFGNSTILKVNTIDWACLDNEAVVYPNPVNHLLNIAITLVENANVTFEVTDITGKIVKVQNTQMTLGTTTSQIDFSTLDQAIYFVNIKVNGMLLKTEKIQYIR